MCYNKETKIGGAYMDIVKVFGKNLKNIVLPWGYRRRSLLKNVDYIVHISALLNGFNVIYQLKTFNVLLMHLE